MLGGLLAILGGYLVGFKQRSWQREQAAFERQLGVARRLDEALVETERRILNRDVPEGVDRWEVAQKEWEEAWVRESPFLESRDLKNRYEAAGLKTRTSSPSLVADALDALLKVDVKDSPAAALEGLSQYSFDQLFEYLEAHRQAVGEDRLARLEWAYLGALGYDPNVPMLHEQLATSPQFFVEVISALYKERSAEAASEPTEEAKRIAENGYRLLSSWSLVPGQGEDGEIDEAALRKWIDEARELLKAADRLEVGETHIGHILASSGRDAEDRWLSARKSGFENRSASSKPDPLVESASGLLFERERFRSNFAAHNVPARRRNGRR